MTRDELIAALEAATGPDRDLDREIGILCFGWEPGPRSTKSKTRILRTAKGDVYLDAPGGTYPAFTESRDEMLFGAEALFWRIEKQADGYWAAECAVKHHSQGGLIAALRAVAETEPLARRIAEIKALVPAEK